ncbi:MAG: helix-turn-helix domain-containing protein [Patescibacteria group bacterium]|nr:helix-turn-helix domain-containing protein [Patescibacteria group bacterium]MCX7589397.1 helix-turn-helix domain-containing protein [Patescibacteria group bacterium]MDW8279691.1 helix-turn-helix domain-containing protein [bacterium]
MNYEDKNFKIFLEEKLKEKGLNLKRLSEISGISLNHLEDLINENFYNLPAAPYIRGYLFKIGKILGFNGEEWWEYFKNKKELKSSGENDEFPQNRFVSVKLTKYILSGLIFLLILIYIFFRFNAILGKPVIKLNLPESILNVDQKNFIIEGKIENADKLFVNGEEINFNQNGEFNKELILEPGINNIEIRIQKLLRPEVKILRQIFYEERQNNTNNTTTINNLLMPINNSTSTNN